MRWHSIPCEQVILTLRSRTKYWQIQDCLVRSRMLCLLRIFFGVL